MKKETCYTLLLGARQASGKRGRFKSSDEAPLREITRKYFSKGFTILRAEGGWFDPAKGKFIEEDSRQVLVCAAHSSALRPWCRELARVFRQKELLVTALGPAITFHFRVR